MPDNQTGEMVRVDTSLESALESVDEAESAVLEVATGIGFDEDDLHRIGMAVREAMVNAVVHGNRYSARKKVKLQVLQGPDRLAVVIQDEGEGFEVTDVPNPLSDENLLRHSGRGLLLIKEFMDEAVVHKTEPRGTEVRMVKYLAKAG
jgi:serine/threonine-protein kinase RsbW